MDNRAEVREFLTTRRAKVAPAEAGLPEAGQRRVPGLRRAETAVLAGISVEYYAKLERGALAGVSASVLEALARPRRRSTARWTPRPSLQWALDAITAGPAIVRNGRMDLLATNTLGRAMHSCLYEGVAPSPPGSAEAPPNFARYTFLDEDSRRFYPAWDTAAATCVSILRTEAGRDPRDRAMHDLVGELSTRSEEFRRLWGAHDVRLHGAGSKAFHHTAVGELDLAYESMDMVSEPGLTMTVYAAEPASPTAQALVLLASWAATEIPARAAQLPAP